MNDVTKAISKMIPNGSRLELPTDEHFNNYAQVKKALTIAGGKYKRCGFEFADDAATVQARLVGGEVINDKKKYQFFVTPPPLARRMVSEADIQTYHQCLEPSAGNGAIACQMPHRGNLTTVELMPANVMSLRRQGYDPIEGDFLQMTSEDLGRFDRIVANPPFTANQDIDHIRHMHSLLVEGGVLVSLASRSWMRGSQKKQVAFSDWVEREDASVTPVPAGTFKSSGTNIAACLIVMQRRSES